MSQYQLAQHIQLSALLVHHEKSLQECKMSSNHALLTFKLPIICVNAQNHRTNQNNGSSQANYKLSTKLFLPVSCGQLRSRSSTPLAGKIELELKI